MFSTNNGGTFSHVLIDCVGPLPEIKEGNKYLLTIMYVVTRFPEVVPLRNIKAKTIAKALLQSSSRVGLPVEVQHDNGSNFTSALFQKIMNEFVTFLRCWRRWTQVQKTASNRN